MNTNYAVLRAIGSDRIGIVDELSAIIEQVHCNIEESSMLVLGGEFAVMILISGTEEAITTLQNYSFDTSEVSDLTIDIVITPVVFARKEGIGYTLHVVALDSPGIVHAVSAILAQEEINIEELESVTSAAPFTGSPLFTLTIRITISSPKRAHVLRDLLMQLAHERDLDLTLTQSSR